MAWNEKLGNIRLQYKLHAGKIQSNVRIVLAFCIELGYFKKQQNNTLIFISTLECLMPLSQSNYMILWKAVYEGATKLGFLKLVMSIILVQHFHSIESIF